MMCREIVRIARNLPWQMKFGMPFHCSIETDIPAFLRAGALDALTELFLRPIVMKAMSNRSVELIDMSLSDHADAVESLQVFDGVTCRVLMWLISNGTERLRVDLEFAGASCDIPLYIWLGEQAE